MSETDIPSWEEINGYDTITETAPPELKKPSLWKVVFLNDDYTPMDFVVEMLTGQFGQSSNDAERVTWEIHQTGKGIAGTYTFEIAETKAYIVMQKAQENEYPLKLSLEECDE